MKRTDSTIARRARPLFVLTTLVAAIALAFSPGVPAVAALSASPDPSEATTPSPDPGPSIAPDPTPSVEPDPTPGPTPEPTPEPTPDPTPEPPTAAPEPPPDTTTPAPTDATTPAPTDPTTPAPTDPAPLPTDSNPPSPSDAPSPSADPTPYAGPTPFPEPTPSTSPSAEPTATPIAGPTGPNALRFDAVADGSAIADASDTIGLRLFTIETWFRRGGSGAGPRADHGAMTGEGGLRSAIPLLARGSYDPIAPRQDPADRINWFLGIDADTSVLAADFLDTTGSNHPILGTTTLADGVWYHAAATFDGVAWRLYLNGRLEAEQPAAGADPDPSGLARIALATSLAADGQTARGAFDGSLDEVRVWSLARGTRDIREDMRRPIDPDALGLVAAWALDQDSGAIAPDSVRPGIPLTLRGSATWVDSPVPDASIPPAPRSLSGFATLNGIALTWAPVAADDLAGYAVYRSSGSTVDPTGGPISGWRAVTSNSFLDDTALAGVTYRYVVTAVDRYGNESDPSTDASATVETPAGASPLIEVLQDLSSTAPATGRRRIDPGAATNLLVSVTPTQDLTAGTLALEIPAGWTIADAAGGASVVGDPRLAWDLTNIPAGTPVTRNVALMAPLVSPLDGGMDVESTFSLAFEQAGGVSDGPSLTLLVAPPVVIERGALGQVDDRTLTPVYLAEGAAITDQQRFDVFRVRFQVQNLDDVAVDVTPSLEVRDQADGALGAFASVPASEGVAGSPFFVTQEWTPVGGRTAGTELSGSGGPIDPAALRMTVAPADGLTPTRGHHSMGLNPAPILSLPPRSVTEVEFSVRATVDAAYLSTYEFRLSDVGAAIAGAATATVGLGPQPPLLLSPGQLQGAPVGGGTSGTAAEAVAYRLAPPDVATTLDAPRYALLASARTPVGSGPAALDALGSDPAHGPFAGSTDACAVCHGSHSAKGANLLNAPTSQSNLCFRCHDSAGSGASTTVQAQYTDPNVPSNDPAAGAYFRHDALATGSGHTQAQMDEFGGQANRHNECGDCHDPHAANAAASTQTSLGGWTAPGQLNGISGVSVANGVAGTAPSYSFLDGIAAPITLEYQLCFKCHSGFTTLNARDALHPSRWAQDKGKELNPANDSFHPIEAAGKNATVAMANSLAGTSPYKLWNFTTGSTVRCVNCHGDPRKVASGTPPEAGSDLAPHAVATVVAADGTQLNRGLLLQPYRDRILTSPTAAYDAQDSALCLVCHKQAPFVDTSGDARTDTNFRYHGMHVAELDGKGAGLGDIDTPGAGRGNAICSECHYRIHSTSSRNDFRTSPLQTGTDGGLVLFSPNVTGTDSPSTLDWTRTGANSGTCTLRCHGEGHSGESYGP